MLIVQNDRIFMSHHHEAEDGFANLEEIDGLNHAEDHESAYSVGHSSSIRPENTIGSRRFDSTVPCSILDSCPKSH